MYKTKPCFRCSMPSEAPLHVLALNASLKHEPTLSSTGELASRVLEEIRALAQISDEVIRLSDELLLSVWAFAKRRMTTGRTL